MEKLKLIKTDNRGKRKKETWYSQEIYERVKCPTVS